MGANIVGWIRSGRTGAFLLRAKQIEVFDRSYQIAAQLFVALLPLILVLTVLITGGQQYLAQSMINRFELVGYAAQSVRDLLRSESGQIYWSGVLLSLYASFSLSRRVSRAYNMIWQVPQLSVRDQWRGMVWVFIQLLLILATSGLRSLLWQSGPFVAVFTLVAVVASWTIAEFSSQWLLTKGQVQRYRLLLAASLVAVGKVGASVWALWYLSHSMNRQAELYGPLGVVFSLFTYLLVLSGTMLVCTMAVAVATEPATARGALPEGEALQRAEN